MTTIGTEATLHERTVQAVALGTVQVPVVPQNRPQGRRSTTRTRHVRVHRGVWRTARRLAGNDPRRIEIISEDEVVVHNPGWRKS